MHRPISEHLLNLHQRIHDLKRKLEDDLLATEERSRVWRELATARQAEDHYRKALELERRLG